MSLTKANIEPYQGKGWLKVWSELDDAARDALKELLEGNRNVDTNQVLVGYEKALSEQQLISKYKGYPVWFEKLGGQLCVWFPIMVADMPFDQNEAVLQVWDKKRWEDFYSIKSQQDADEAEKLVRKPDTDWAGRPLWYRILAGGRFYLKHPTLLNNPGVFIGTSTQPPRWIKHDKEDRHS